MGHKLSWLVPGRVIDVVILEDKEGEDTRTVFDDDIIAMLDTASEPVHLLLDVRAMTGAPAPSTRGAMEMSYLKHPQMGRLLVIGLAGNPILRFLSALVSRTSGVKIREFPTHEDAHTYLKSVEKL